MIGYFRICNLLHWYGLLLWAAALIAAAVAAMNVFGTLGDMELALADYPAVPADDHPLLAAGHIMNGVFRVVDALQFVAVPVVMLTLIAQLVVFRMSIRRVSNVLRTLCVVGAASLFTWYAVELAPDMNRQLAARWTAAAAGDLDRAETAREAFDALHPRAEIVLEVNLILILIAIGGTAVALGPVRCPGESELQTPTLAT